MEIAKQHFTPSPVIRGLLTSREPLVLTSYHWPDVDGVACCFGLKEILEHSRRTARIALFEALQFEAEWLLNRLDIVTPRGVISADDKVVLLDASNREDIPSHIASSSVVGIIDHRSDSNTRVFKNAASQIVRTGSAASIVASHALANHIRISEKTAALLVSAIASNTSNLCSSETTELDRQVYSRLRELYLQSGECVEAMFHEKTAFVRRDLFIALERDTSSRNYFIAGHAISIAQVEMLDAEVFIRENAGEIASNLQRLRVERKADATILVGVDLSKGRTVLVCPDVAVHDVVARALPDFVCTSETSIVAPYVISRKTLIQRLLS